MSNDRTTINVDQGTHQEAREVKDEYNESWPDVLRFYARHRPTVQIAESEQSEMDLEAVMNQLSMANEPGVEVPVEEMMSEIRKAQEIAEQARDNTEQIKQGIR